jgi:hypothetical protein
MAVGHFMTNKGKLRLIQGAWNTGGIYDFRIGLIQSAQPANFDTAAEIADLNTVYDLLVTGGVVEATFSNYARKNLQRTAASEDDANDVANLTAANVVWAAAGVDYVSTPVQNTLYGAFIYDAATDTDDTTRLLISIDWFYASVATVGSDLTYSISSLYRIS